MKVSLRVDRLSVNDSLFQLPFSTREKKFVNIGHVDEGSIHRDIQKEELGNDVSHPFLIVSFDTDLGNQGYQYDMKAYGVLEALAFVGGFYVAIEFILRLAI